MTFFVSFAFLLGLLLHGSGAAFSCPATFTLYTDDGSEGKDSCLHVSSAAISSWTVASTYCTGLGAKLVTFSYSGNTPTTNGILNKMIALAPSKHFWVGASQAAGQADRRTGWTWVDGGSTANLVVASGGTRVWASGQPSDTPSTGGNQESDNENYGFYYSGVTGGIADVSVTFSSTFAGCEVDVPTPTRTPTFSATSSQSRSFSSSATRSDSITPSASPTATVTFTRTVSVSFSPSGSSTFSVTPTFSATPSVTGSRTFSSSSSVSTTPSVTATPSVTPSATLTKTSTFSATPSLTCTTSATVTPSSSATVTPTVTVTFTASVSATATVTASVTSSPSSTATSTATVTTTSTGSRTPTVTATISESSTFSATTSGSATVTATVTSTASSTFSATASVTSSGSSTPTVSTTASASATATVTSSSSATGTATTSRTVTRSSSASATVSVSWSFTATASASATPRCLAGSYCPSRELAAATPCPPGSYCPADSATPVPCPGGSWSDVTSAQSLLQCTACDPGYYCSEPATAQQPCPAGRYGDALSLATSGCSGACAAGYYCPVQSVSNTSFPCGGDGFFCPASSPAPVSVPAGSYSTGGTAVTRTSTALCAAGSFCPGSGSGLSVPCPSGRFGAVGALVDSACSGPCKPGYFCAEGSVNDTAEACGSVALYCPEGTPSRVAVDDGFVGVGATLVTLTSAAACQSGAYCTGGIQTLCAPGRWSDVISRSSPCTSVCTAGYYCPDGSKLATPFQCGNASVYCAAGSGSPVAVGAGFYSVGGADAFTRTDREACPSPDSNGGVGVYCPGTGDAVACPAGRFGDASGLPSSACSGECAQGYVCPAGSTSPQAQACGAVDRYCPGGSGSPTPVAVGWYSAPVTDDVMYRYTSTRCGPGQYCVGGAQLLCDGGTFSDILGRSSSCTDVCPAGYFCAPGTGALSSVISCSSPWHHCPEASSNYSLTRSGYYAVATLQGLFYEEQVCEPGHFCEAGVRYPCAAGRYGTVTGESSSACSGVCSAGYFCEPASTSPTQDVCGGSHLYCPEGSATRLVAAPGYYTLPVAAPETLREALAMCEPGMYCANGIAMPCPSGRFGSVFGLPTRQCSGECAGGYFCPDRSTAPTQVPCGSPDVYCPAGSGAPVVVLPGQYSAGGSSNATRVFTKSCTSGSYCVSGVLRPCPAGRYGCSILMSDPACNGACLEGHYCSPGSDSATQHACGSTSVYCPEGSTAPVPVNASYFGTGGPADRQTKQQLCQPGYYCDSGMQLPCPLGRFGSSSGLVSALCDGVCNSGYSCPPASVSRTEVLCGRGQYCVSGVAFPCPMGTYYPEQGAALLGQCVLCPAGTFGPAAGAVNESAACVPCAGGEGSVAGSVACWPGLVQAYAANPPPLEVGLSTGDTVSVVFTKPTNQPLYPSGGMASVVRFQPAVAAEFSSQWVEGGRVLVLRVDSVTGIDVDAAAVRFVSVQVLQSAGIRDVTGASSPANLPLVPLSGTWGASAPPAFLSATAVSVGNANALGVGNSTGLSAGDRLRLQFDQRLFPLSLANDSAARRVFAFSPALPSGAAVEGVWVSGTVVDLVFTSFPPLNDSARSAFAVGVLVVSVLPSGGLQSFDLQSGSSNSSVLVASGSWGDVPSATLFELSSSSARVVVSPAVGGAVAMGVQWYVVRWAAAGGFAALAPCPSTWEEVLALNSGRNGSVGVGLSVDGSSGIAGLTVVALELDVVWGVGGMVALARLSDAAGAQPQPLPGTLEFDITSLTAGVSYSVAVAAGYNNATGPLAATEPASVTPSSPVISRVLLRSSTLACVGGEAMTFVGVRLGRSRSAVSLEYSNADAHQPVTYAFNTSACAVTVDLVTVVCSSVPGVGVGYRAVLVVDGTRSLPSQETFSYAPPVIVVLSGAGAVGGSTAGGEAVRVLGSGFGPVGLVPNPILFAWYSPRDLPSYTFPALRCAVVSSDEALECVSSGGVGTALVWLVNVAGQNSSAGMTSYQPPVVTSLVVQSAAGVAVAVDTLDTRGGAVMVFSGSGFGPALPTPFLGDVVGQNGADLRVLASRCNVTRAHVEVVCFTPPAVGVGLVWTVSVGGQVSLPASTVTSYAVAMVTDVSVGAAGSGALTLPTSGGAEVYVSGNFFGVDVAQVQVLLDGRVYSGVQVAFVEPQVLLRFVSPVVEGVQVVLGLTVGRQPVDVPVSCQVLRIGAPVVTSLALVRVSGVQPLVCSAAGEPYGITKLVVYGANFGEGTRTQLTLGPAPCTLVLSQSSHSQLTCITGLCSGTLTVSVGGQTSTPVQYDFLGLSQPPSIADVSPLFGPTSGGTLLTLTGLHFGVNGDVYLVHPVTSQKVDCVWRDTPTMLYSEALIRCVVPAGQGTGYRFLIVVDFVPSLASSLVWNYNAPVVSSVLPAVLSSMGGQVLVVQGANFGQRTFDVGVTVGARACSVLHWSDTRINCTTPAGAAPSAGVVVSVSGQSNALSPAPTAAGAAATDRVAYAGPRPDSVDVRLFGSVGGERVQVCGSGFGELVSVWFTHQHAMDVERDVSLLADGQSLLCAVLISNASCLTCSAPAGSGTGWAVAVVNHDEALSVLSPVAAIAGAVANLTVRYHAPQLVSVSPFVVSAVSARPATGGFVVIATGLNFSAVPTVMVGAVPCAVLSSGHTWLNFTAPPRNMLLPNTVRVGAGGVWSEGLELEYDAGVVTGVRPNVLDAIEGSTGGSGRGVVLVDGYNFGPKPLGTAGTGSHSVFVGEVPCGVSDWYSDTGLGCTLTGNFSAGVYNVSVVLASTGERSVWTVGAGVRVECQEGFYSAACAPCPSGATCAGRGAVPVALPGYFPASPSLFVACQPEDACVGGSGLPCAPAYKGPNCGECAVKHYRLQGRCKACPNTAWLLFLIFTLILVAMVAIAVYLNRKRINLAGLSIGVDVLQIVSMFASYKFNWPPALVTLYNSLSFANFNIELLAPECSLSVNYATKWFLTACIPVLLCAVIVGVLVLARVFQFLQRKVLGRLPLGATSDVHLIDVCLGILLTGLYYIYFVVIRTALAPFNCVSRDGVSTMESEPSVHCYTGTGPHAAIVPWAMAALVVYGFGIPVSFGVILYKFHSQICADQALREMGEGDIPANNPNIRVRHKFRKLYEDFKPHLSFWKLVLIARKFAIAVTAMMLSQKPMLQASISATVLFASYAAQVRYRPFMPVRQVAESFYSLLSAGKRRRGGVYLRSAASSASGRVSWLDALPRCTGPQGALTGAVVEAHSPKPLAPSAPSPSSARAPSSRHLALSLASAQLAAGPRTPSAAAAANSSNNKAAALLAMTSSASSIIDYNNLESTFVFTAMMILLGGMLFSSSAFPPGSPMYIGLTVVVCAVIIGTVLLFVGLIVFEVYRAIRYSGLHQVARTLESAATEERLMAGGRSPSGGRVGWREGRMRAAGGSGSVRAFKRAGSAAPVAAETDAVVVQSPLRRVSQFSVANPLRAPRTASHTTASA